MTETCWRGFREETWWRRFREEAWWRQTYLAIHLGRIMLLPEDIKQLFVRDLGRVIFQLYSFCVACPATADLAICWIYRLASCVTDCCLHIRKASKHTANDQFYCPFSIPVTTPPNAWNLGDKGKSSPTRYTKKEFCILLLYEFVYLDDARNALESQFDAPETSGCKCGLLLYHFHSPKKIIRAPLLVLLPSTHKKQAIFSLSLSRVWTPRAQISISKQLSKRSHSPKLHQPAQKKKHSLQGFRFTKTFKITQNQTIEINTVYRSRVKYIPSAQRDETIREAKRRDEATKKEKQNNSERGERERSSERRVLFEN